MEYKRLYKSSTDKAIFGVCGGFAEYFGIDSLIVRLVLVLFTLAFGAGLFFYIVAALLMPKRPEDGGQPVQPEQPGAYNAGGSTYVNRASSPEDAYTPYTGPAQPVYTEAVPQEVTRSAAPQPAEAEPVQEAPADPVESAWQKEYRAQQRRMGIDVEEPEEPAPKAEPLPQAEPAPKAEPADEQPQAKRSYQAYETYQQPRETAREYSGQAKSKDHTRTVLGILLILLGAFVLVRVFLPHFDTRILFAVCVIVAGGLLISKRDK